MECAACGLTGVLEENKLLCSLYCKDCKIEWLALGYVEEFKKLREFQHVGNE